MSVSEVDVEMKLELSLPDNPEEPDWLPKFGMGGSGLCVCFTVLLPNGSSGVLECAAADALGFGVVPVALFAVCPPTAASPSAPCGVDIPCMCDVFTPPKFI